MKPIRRKQQGATGPRHLGVLVVVLALVLAACAGEDDGEAGEEAADEPSAAADDGADGADEPDDGAEAADDAEADDDAAATFYEGQTIEMVVAFGPGGGTDAAARWAAPLLSESIPGNPDIQVVNIEGADTLIGTNEFANREPDGLSLLMGAGTSNLYNLFGHPDMDFDYADWIPLFALPQGSVVYVNPDTGVQSPSDLLDPPEELIYPVRSPEGGDLPRLLTMDLMGAEYRAVFGYDSGGDARLAYETGEGNVGSDASGAFVNNVLPLVEEGGALPLWSMGQTEGGEFVRDSAVPEIPTFMEVYEEVHGEPLGGIEFLALQMMIDAQATFNKTLFVHRDAPPEAIAALRAGVEAMSDVPGYEDREAVGGYDVLRGAAFEQDVLSVLEPDPEVADWVRQYATETHGAQFD